MNRLIMKHGTVVTAVILAIFAWVVWSRIHRGGVGAVAVLGVTAVAVWVLGTVTFVYLWPRITVGGFKRTLRGRGLGGGPIPVNTVYAVPESPSESAAAGNVIATGTDDLVYLAGWVDVRGGPQLLHVPEVGGRYYSVQLTDPTSGANVAYVGTRATGSAAGTFLLCAPAWQGAAPPQTTRIDLPHRAALIIGRVFVADDADRPAAYALARQIELAPLVNRPEA